MIEKIKKYHIPYIVVLVINIYFFITSLISYIQSDSYFGLFAVVFYALAIIYLSIMELFTSLRTNVRLAYFITIIYLIAITFLLPIMAIVSATTGKMSGTYKLATSAQVFTSIYIVYLTIRIIIPLITALVNRIKKNDYGRCKSFGNIITNLYASNIFVVTIAVSMMEQVVAINVLIFGMSIPIMMISFFLIFKCFIGMVKKRNQV
ncbi:MAG: hypothetical protein K6C32_02920 [Bacilli bacterium]|nr:hypothetical protein [Bacilli bacterium]